MSKRKDFINYVKHGGKRPVCSPQIGAGAGFDAKTLGKPYAAIEDTVKVCNMFDMLPLYNFGLDVREADKKLVWEPRGERKQENVTVSRSVIETPYGDLVNEVSSTPDGHAYRSGDPVRGVEDYDKFSWYLDQIYGGDFTGFEKAAAGANKLIGQGGAIDFQWGMQPYELFGMPSTLNTMLFAMDNEEEFTSLAEKCCAISLKVIDAVADGGADFVFLGGPAAEMVNPYIYDTFMVPFGKRTADRAHKKGLLVYSHVCSPVEPFLSLGYFNKLGIDLFETLSMPPVGNVKSIEDAFTKLDGGICTRGNIGIDVLINGEPRQVTELVYHIMREAIKAKRKHMVAASDYLMSECKFENVKALCDAVKNFKE